MLIIKRVKNLTENPITVSGVTIPSDSNYHDIPRNNWGELAKTNIFNQSTLDPISLLWNDGEKDITSPLDIALFLAFGTTASSGELSLKETYFDTNGRFKMSIQNEPHGSTHSHNSNDPIDVTNLPGLLRDPQVATEASVKSALGPKSNSNPYNHDRFTQQEIVGLFESQLNLNYPTHSNTNDPDSNQKAALNAAQSPTNTNPFLTKSFADLNYSSSGHSHSTLPTTAEKEALTNSTSPSSANPFITKSVLDNHTNNQGNPHNTTKSQVGLGNVDNTSDANKPISSATQTALNAKENIINPGTTSQYLRGDKSWQTLDKNAVGLGSVDNTSDANKPVSSATQAALNLKLNTSLLGVANGIATLGADAKIPAAQLPSFVDDVLEYTSLTLFPATGESGKIYTDTTTNKTYRWSGSQYTEISPSIALGETSSTAYRGDRGKTAYDHSQLTGNPHGTTKADLNLGNVDNTSDASKPISTATQNALNAKENLLPSGTSSQYLRGDKSWQTLDKNAVGLSSVSNDAQLKINSNLSDLNNTSTARTNLGLGNSATKNVGSGVNDVASGSHTHTLNQISDIPAKPNNGSNNLLIENNNNLTWSTVPSLLSKRRFEYQVNRRNANNGISQILNIYTNPTYSNSGYTGSNVFPLFFSYSAKLVEAIIIFTSSTFDYRSSAGDIYLGLKLMNQVGNSHSELTTMKLTIPGSFTNTSYSNSAGFKARITTVEQVSGNIIIPVNSLIGVAIADPVGAGPGRITKIGNPYISLIFEEA